MRIRCVPLSGLVGRIAGKNTVRPRVVSLAGAPFSLPSSITPKFQEFFRLSRVLRTTLPTERSGSSLCRLRLSGGGGGC